MANREIDPDTRKNRELCCQLAGRLWLEYYNRTLYEKGLITEREHRRMSLKISGWKMIPS